MEWLSPVLMAIQVISSLSIIVLVLLQQGKGADMGSAFGSGSAGSLFGAAGAANFLSRTTKWAAIAFFASTIGLAWVSHRPDGKVVDGGVMQGFEVPQIPGSSVPGAAVPAVPSVPGSAPGQPEASQAGEVPAAPGQSAPASGADALDPKHAAGASAQQ
jgi:preprotein translocase subunit SecG